MTVVRVSERGQISIPAAARKKLGIKPKSRVRVEIRENEIIIKPMKSILELGGILREHAKGKTGDWDTQRAIAMEEVAREVMSETED